jgi:hypothetical protein
MPGCDVCGRTDVRLYVSSTTLLSSRSFSGALIPGLCRRHLLFKRYITGEGDHYFAKSPRWILRNALVSDGTTLHYPAVVDDATGSLVIPSGEPEESQPYIDKWLALSPT